MPEAVPQMPVTMVVVGDGQALKFGGAGGGTGAGPEVHKTVMPATDKTTRILRIV